MAEIEVLSSNGVRAVLDELAPPFERTTGHRLAITFGATAVLRTKIEGGPGLLDLAILTDQAVHDLVRQGLLMGPGTVLARSGVGVAVRAGAPQPDIGTAEAFKRALLAARSVAYSAQGASGQYFLTVLDRLGIANEIKAKARTQTGGMVAELVARGEAELAVQQISELLPVKGVEFVGPLPGELQRFTAFAAALGTAAKEPDGAKSLIRFLTAPSARAVIEAKGMAPGNAASAGTRKRSPKLLKVGEPTPLGRP
jgi:molybdate transport system substrate-binding protein